MAKLSDLRDAALADQAIVTTDKAELTKAQAALDTSTATAAVSTPAFGEAIVKKGGQVLDTTVTPAVIWTAPPDGSTFSSVTPSLITDDAP